jgi:hypothetical protein
MTIYPSMIMTLLCAMAWAESILVGIQEWAKKSAEVYFSVRLPLGYPKGILNR